MLKLSEDWELNCLNLGLERRLSGGRDLGSWEPEGNVVEFRAGYVFGGGFVTNGF